MQNKSLLVAALACALAGCAAPHGQFAVVVAPVADVRSKPGYLPTGYSHDDAQETQLLLGEEVRVEKTQGDWALIEAIEQPEYTHHDRWEGYPGWALQSTLKSISHEQRAAAAANAIIVVKWAPAWLDEPLTQPAEPLPMGAAVKVTDDTGERWRIQLPTGDRVGDEGVPTRDGAAAEAVWVARASVRRWQDLAHVTAEERRRLVLSAAQELLGDPYLWGGRSPHDNARSLPITGIDCSGLVNLAYRVAGIRLPRDAHEQYLRARPVLAPAPGDLVFLSSPDRPDRMTHVMLYAGNEELIEAPGTGEQVRRITTHDRLGRALRGLRPGDRVGNENVPRAEGGAAESVGGRRVFFGAYLP